MNYYEKKNQVQIKINLEALLRIMAQADVDVPKGLPDKVYMSLDNVLELTWEQPEAPVPF